MRLLTLALGQREEVPGGAVEFTDVVSHAGEEKVARFRAWSDESWREVELTPGGLFSAGQALLEVRRFESREAPAELALFPLPVEAELSVPLGEPFDAPLGRWCRLPTGNRLMLTGLGRFGVGYFLAEKNGVENARWCDFGFWREDGLLIRALSEDKAHRSARLMVDRDEDVSTRRAATYGAPVELGAYEVREYPDGLTLRLRSCQRHSWGAVGWDLYAHQGDGAAYPSLSLAPGGRARQEFSLLARKHALTASSMRLGAAPALEVALVAEAMEPFPLGQEFELLQGAPRSGPEGLVLEFYGAGHGHGFSLRVGGERVPRTDAWADFNVVQGGATRGFRVDLMQPTEPQTHERFGYRFQVLGAHEGGARLLVRRV